MVAMMAVFGQSLVSSLKNPIGLTLRHSVRPPMAWVICLIISMITFLGLVIFKGRSLLAEFEKRLHL